MIFSFLDGIAQSGAWDYSLVLGGQVVSSSVSSKVLTSSDCIQIYANNAVVATAKEFSVIINGKTYSSETCSLTKEMKDAISSMRSGQKIRFMNMVVVGSSVCPRVLQDKMIQIK